MLLDEFMPQWHFTEYHETMAAAGPQRSYQACRDIDMRRSPASRLLMKLRELPIRIGSQDFQTKGLGFTMDDLEEVGFLSLAKDPPREFVMGLVGRFWSKEIRLERMSPQEFKEFDTQGFAKVAVNLLVTRLGEETCRLSTETRVLCLGPEAKKGFRRYWTMIRPFSGVIRLEWLRLARQGAERP